MPVARDAHAQQTLGVNLMEKLNKVRADAGTISLLSLYVPRKSTSIVGASHCVTRFAVLLLA